MKDARGLDSLSGWLECKQKTSALFESTSPATGFYLLWGYILAAVFKIYPTITFDRIVAFLGTVGTIAMSVACILCCAVAKKLYLFLLK